MTQSTTSSFMQWLRVHVRIVHWPLAGHVQVALIQILANYMIFFFFFLNKMTVFEFDNACLLNDKLLPPVCSDAI